jgi:hypothetical protein
MIVFGVNLNSVVACVLAFLQLGKTPSSYSLLHPHHSSFTTTLMIARILWTTLQHPVTLSFVSLKTTHPCNERFKHTLLTDYQAVHCAISIACTPPPNSFTNLIDS